MSPTNAARMLTQRMAMIALGMLAACVWVGSLVCLAIVSAAARSVLDPSARVSLFRRIGRLYGVVGTGSLVVAIIMGLALAWPPSGFPAAVSLLFGVSALLLLATALGMLQARRMSIERQRLLDAPDDDDAAKRVRRGAALALALRGSIGLVTLFIIAVGAHLLDR